MFKLKNFMSEKKLEKAKRLGSLLASSPIAHELKMAILANLSKMPEKYLDALVVSLENEAKGIEILIKEVDDFIKTQDADWEKVADDQIELADKIVSEEVLELKKEDRIASLRQNLTGSNTNQAAV